MKILKKVLLTLLLLALVALVSFSAYYLIVTSGVKLNKEKLLLPDVQISAYDQAGEKITRGIGFHNRETVSVKALSEHTKNAFICTEDKRFYQHGGFDLLRIGKAAIKNLKAGSFKEGASTISQQLVKNTHLSHEKTFKRKLREMKLTKKLEREFSKDEILEMYLNTIYFGHSCYGIQSAAQFYFGKSADRLTVGEAAILAGLVRSPNNYSPFKNAEKCRTRRATVLGLMRAQNALSQAEYEAANEETLPAAPNKTENGLSYLHFALDELETLFEQQRLPVGGKIELYTYLVTELQEQAEMLSSEKETGRTVVVLDNETGGFQAFFSTVGDLRRLPASTIKPLAVYAPAFETGILSLATPILDEPICYGEYQPKNYDGKYRGYVSAREALSQSLNVPAVKTLDAIGVNTAAAYLQKMGLPVLQEDKTLALALGGMKNGFTLSELVSAYSTFPQDGKFRAGGFLKKVVVDGKTVYERGEEKRTVFSPETAYLTTDALRTSVYSGTAKKLRSLPFQIAAKTGTTGTEKGNTDAYTISYTSKHTVGVWMGNADNSPITCTGGGEPCALSHALHEYLFNRSGEKIPDFEKPSRIRCVALDKYAYDRSQRLLLADTSAPAQYKFNELFNGKYTPRESSTLFSSPAITSPTIERTENGVLIRLPDSAPSFYSYEIARKNGKNTQVLYHGEWKKEHLDQTVTVDTTYEYTITPYYRTIRGKSVTLPAVSIAKNEKPPKILDGNWWEQ